MWKRY